MTTPPPLDTPLPSDVAHLQLKARLLMLFMVLLVVSSGVYVLYARGWFEETRHLVLVAEDSEGVIVGMDMTFSGFPIGRVQRIALGPDGKAHIVVEISAKDAHWLRTSSVFTLVRSVVGGTNLRAYSGMPTDPPLPDNAERSVLQGDVGAELPKVIASTRELLDNLAALTGRVNEPTGTLDKANQLLAQANTLAAKADTQVFGKQGVLPETRATVVQLKSLLMEARTSLQKVDLVLHNAQKVSADAATITDNAAKASVDLGALRADVDASLRNVQGLVDDINRKWPFARDREITLP
jgi:phospholipid/cholesterol/gamma-HCH transport system substrate-binding protein